MGKYDSSKYRVVPLVESIKNDERNFEKFLGTVDSMPRLSFPSDENAYYYGDNEKQLKPPKAHLDALIDYMASKKHNESSKLSHKRKALFGLDTPANREKTREEAKRLLEAVYDAQVLPKAWYIFEGATNPDIYIEGKDYVIICEGKWTESHITTNTTHLCEENEYRSQMIRHIQGALNSTWKKVYAFYIVDEDCGYTSDLTLEALKRQIERETIKPNGITSILDSFYGYTTWQKIKSVIPSVHFRSKEEIDSIQYKYWR